MTATPLFRRVLIANRGEIAVRVIRALCDLGITSIAIYSEADADAMHVAMADEAYALGGLTAAESYLDVEKVLVACSTSGAEAVHPGYGFLAENAAFARAVVAAGMAWIGPHADAIDEMGSKTRSREIMRAAGVPVVPGTVEPLEDLELVRAAANEVGYPVAVKARSGGGGKGFRVALTEAELPVAYEGASGEGARYFADAAVYLERYLADPRHVEVQLLADRHGNVVHLGERDCTIQRRHQKLVEESPAPTPPGLPDLDMLALRERLGEIGIGAAKAVGYDSAGTVECLLDGEGTPYFLEMNTRVQVEHCVTELVTGVDIVAEQVRIAAGQPLQLRQQDVELRGHAIEVRLNAEDAREDFRPASGAITAWHQPAGPGVRVDAGVRSGSVVSSYYDTLLAKVIAWGEDREQARVRLLRALDEFEITGPATLLDFHRALLAREEFVTATSCRDLVEDPGALLDSAGFAARPAVSLDADRGEPAARLVADEHVVEVDGRRLQVRVFDRDVSARRPPMVRDQRRGSSATGDAIVAPIPGNVLRVAVSDGQSVSAGELLCVLEAMKMENEIVAPSDGVVADVSVEAGASVPAGHRLLRVVAHAAS